MKNRSKIMRPLPKFIFVRLFLPILVSLSLVACGKPPMHQEQRYIFGTLVEVSIYGESDSKAGAATGAVMREFERLHQKLHAWRPSELSRLNSAFARGEKVRTDQETIALLQNAARWSKASDGLFNPAIGGLIELWGFQADEFKPVRPDPAAIKKLLAANPQMQDIAIDGDSVFSNNRAVKLDFGGYAKGYALDRAAAILREHGIENALINIGGNIIALGRHGSKPWHVGIQDPRNSGAIAELDLHDGEAIGTSGDYQRYFMQDGKRYCHIIDPRSGFPADGFESVTVLIPKGVQAGALSDIASKPVFISGVDGWRDAARRIGVDQVLAVDRFGNLHVTEKFAKRIELLKKNKVVEMAR